MWTRVARYGSGAAVIAVTGSLLYTRGDELRVRTARLLVDLPPSESVGRNGNETLFPRGTWDYNWDYREPLCTIDPAKYAAADDEKRKEMLAAAKPTATRYIYLIRHVALCFDARRVKEAAYFKGQYHLDSTLKNLTELGQEQARLVGKRFAASEQKYDQLTMSTMQRATETANLMMEQMPPVPSRSDSLLEEGAPYPPVPSVSHWVPKMKDFAVEGSRIEAAFRRYIHRASPRQEKDSRK